MNYIELINRFWRCDLEHLFTSNDTRLYFYLVHTCNQLGWKMPFGHSDRHLAAVAGMSVPTVRDCKKRLRERGLIMCEAPQTKSKGFEGQTRYWFPTVQTVCTDDCTDGLTVPLTDGYTVVPTVQTICTDGCTDNCTDGYTEGLTNNKLNKTKQDYYLTPLIPPLEKSVEEKKDFKDDSDSKKVPDRLAPNADKPKKRRKVAPKEENDFLLSLPFSSEKFTDAWNMILQMPKWKTKPPQSLQLALKKLSRYDEEFATHLVENAVTKNWQGVVFPDTDEKYQQWNQNKSENGNKTIYKRTGSPKNIALENTIPMRNYKERF